LIISVIVIERLLQQAIVSNHTVTFPCKNNHP